MKISDEIRTEIRIESDGFVAVFERQLELHELRIGCGAVAVDLGVVRVAADCFGVVFNGRWIVTFLEGLVAQVALLVGQFGVYVR